MEGMTLASKAYEVINSNKYYAALNKEYEAFHDEYKDVISKNIDSVVESNKETKSGKVVAGLPLEDRKTRAEKSLVSALQIMENISDNIPQTFRCLTKPDISIFLLWALSHLRRHELQTGFLSNPTWNFPNVLSP